MASSIPAALDWLVAEVRKLAVAQPPVVVSDGWPAARGDLMVVIGVTPEEDDAGITATYAQLSGMDQEDVEIPSIVVVRRAGTDATSAAREAAFEIFDAIRGVVAADRRLGGAVRAGLPARVARWTVSQTADVREAGEGRVCQIRFSIVWRHVG